MICAFERKVILPKGAQTLERENRLLVARYTVLCLLLIVMAPAVARGEAPAPSVHWGSNAFPDQYTALTAALTTDRFTPTDGAGNQFGASVTDTIGLNLFSLSWTRHWDEEVFQGFSTNLTIGGSPTADQPSRYLQDNVVHTLRHIPPVLVKKARNDTDAMADGSVTQWMKFMGDTKALFLGGGFSGGTLYQELFMRGGVRRMHVGPDFGTGDYHLFSVPEDLPFSLRLSLMARQSWLFDGAVLHHVKPASTIWQPALAFGQYRGGGNIPTWEVEISTTWDSGIFVNGSEQSRKQFFWSAAFTAGWFRLETYNDSLGNISKTDFGPTYGLSIAIDLCRCGRFKFLCYS